MIAPKRAASTVCVVASSASMIPLPTVFATAVVTNAPARLAIDAIVTAMPRRRARASRPTSRPRSRCRGSRS